MDDNLSTNIILNEGQMMGILESVKQEDDNEICNNDNELYFDINRGTDGSSAEKLKPFIEDSLESIALEIVEEENNRRNLNPSSNVNQVDLQISLDKADNVSQRIEMSNMEVIKSTSEHHENLEHFVTKDTLKTQISSINKGIRPFQCVECRKSFSTKKYLRYHERTHKETRKFQCYECDKSFSTKKYLHYHENTHKETNQFQCKECGKVSSSPGNLRKHINTIHKRIKKFQCNECGKEFCQRSDFTRHQNAVHKALKPFKCEQCGKCFGWKQALIKHQNITHKALKPFQCEECGKCFTSKQGFVKHQNSIHKQK